MIYALIANNETGKAVMVSVNSLELLNDIVSKRDELEILTTFEGHLRSILQQADLIIIDDPLFGVRYVEN